MAKRIGRGSWTAHSYRSSTRRDAQGGDAGVVLGRTPRGRLTRLERDFLQQPWQKVKDAIEVKLLPAKASSMFWHAARADDKGECHASAATQTTMETLHELQQQTLSRDELLLKLGATRRPPVTLSVGRYFDSYSRQRSTPRRSPFVAQRETARCHRHEGQYLLRSSLVSEDPPSSGNATSS